MIFGCQMALFIMSQFVNAGNLLICMHVPSVTIDNTDMLCMLRNVMIYGWHPGLIIFQDVIKGLIV